MAIYLPPTFCGEGAVLRVIQDMDWNDPANKIHVKTDDIVDVIEIIGYTYVIAPRSQQHVKHRIKNSIMPDYFAIIEPGVKPWAEEAHEMIEKMKIPLVQLKHDFEIENKKCLFTLDLQKGLSSIWK